MWNNKSKLLDRSSSVSDIQDYIEYIIKKINEVLTDNLPIKIHVNKNGNRVRIKIKSEYYLEHLKPETTKLLGSTGDKLNLKIVKIFLV